MRGMFKNSPVRGRGNRPRTRPMCRFFWNHLHHNAIRDAGDHWIRGITLRTEPLLVDLEILAAFDGLHQGVVHDRPEIGVILPHAHPVRLVRVEIAYNLPLVRVLGLVFQAPELDTVVGVCVHPSLDERGVGGGLIREDDQIGLDIPFTQRSLVGGTLLGSDPFSRDVRNPGDRASFLDEELRARHEKRQTEVNAVPAGTGVRHGTRNQINGHAGQKRDTGGRGALLQLKFDRLIQFLLQAFVD